jgi:hypothetical protein
VQPADDTQAHKRVHFIADPGRLWVQTEIGQSVEAVSLRSFPMDIPGRRGKLEISRLCDDAEQLADASACPSVLPLPNPLTLPFRIMFSCIAIL